MAATRRDFIRQAGTLAAGTALAGWFNPLATTNIRAAATRYSGQTPGQLATNEDFWYRVQQAYTCSPNVVNLNNGGVSPQPKAVQEAAVRYLEQANEGPAYYMWRIVDKGRPSVKQKLAELLGAKPDEIALNRNATEGLETVIFGLPLDRGDHVVFLDQDYPAMRNAFYQRHRRDGIDYTELKFPQTPFTDSTAIVDMYRKAITRKTKVILVTHIIHLTGQIMPVRAIADMAHAQGVEVICDAAHSFAQLDYTIKDLDCDYYATSLHKWLCAPFGTGLLWMKRDKISRIWPLLAPNYEAETPEDDNISKFEHLGTRSLGDEIAIGHAVDFHNGIGTDRKEVRLRYLKNYWVYQVKDLPKVRFNSPLTDADSCCIANVQLEGFDSYEVSRRLFRDHNLYTITIKHKDQYEGVRVSPNIYTTLPQLDRLVEALTAIAAGQ